MIRRLLATFAAVIGVVYQCPSANSQTLVLGKQQNEAVQDVAAALLGEIYQRAGLVLLCKPLPAARGTAMVLGGELDGEVARVGEYFVKHPSLFRVEPPYYYLVTTAFANSDRPVSIRSPEDLKRYKVGIIRGVAHSAVITEGLPQLEVANSVLQLFKMLSENRIDIAVDSSLNGRFMAKQFGFDSVRPVAELARHDFYNELAPIRADLAPRISAVISRMAANGELSKLTDTFERVLLSDGSIPVGCKSP